LNFLLPTEKNNTTKKSSSNYTPEHKKNNTTEKKYFNILNTRLVSFHIKYHLYTVEMASRDYNNYNTRDYNRDYNDYSTNRGSSYDSTRDYDYNNTDGANRTSYNPDTGAYDQHIDYDTADGTHRHHREQVDDSGRYYHRDVDTDTTGLDNTSRVHKEYANPNTGTAYHRDATYDRSV
jgi:hypothetical protein